MKKNLTVLSLLLLAFFGTASAQEHTRIGGQLIYGSNINTVGIGVVAEFPIATNMVISPGFSYYFPKKETYIKQTAWELNGNLNYLFVNDDKMEVYALGGLNYTNIGVKIDIDGFAGIDGMSSSAGKIGLNLGAGANFNIGKSFFPFAELKYIISEYDRLVIGAGVKFNL